MLSWPTHSSSRDNIFSNSKFRLFLCHFLSQRDRRGEVLRTGLVLYRPRSRLRLLARRTLRTLLPLRHKKEKPLPLKNISSTCFLLFLARRAGDTHELNWGADGRAGPLLHCRDLSKQWKKHLILKRERKKEKKNFFSSSCIMLLSLCLLTLFFYYSSMLS